MNQLNMANKGITMYFFHFCTYITVYSVLHLLALGIWHLSSNCLGGIFNLCIISLL